MTASPSSSGLRTGKGVSNKRRPYTQVFAGIARKPRFQGAPCLHAMNRSFLPSGPIRKGRFIERPNRFIVKCRIPRVGEVVAHLANPGRLSELLLPGARLHLSLASTPGRKTDYSVLAVERDGAPVFLDTHRTNRVARHLVEHQLIPELRGFELVRGEAPLGKSRFDFLLRKNRRDLYLEVKSCTLFDNGVATFPDAATERGRKHLVELASLDGRARGAVLFLTRHSRNQKGVAARRELSAISHQRSAPGKLFTFCIQFHSSGTDPNAGCPVVHARLPHGSRLQSYFSRS